MFYIRLTSNSTIVLPPSSLLASLPSCPSPAQLTRVPSRVTDPSERHTFAFHFTWKFAGKIKILLPNVSFCSSRHLLWSSFPCWSEVWSCWVFSSTVSATTVRCFTFSCRHSFSLWDFANLWFNLGISEEKNHTNCCQVCLHHWSITLHL